MKTRTVEEKHYFATRAETQTPMIEWAKSSHINRVWFTDRFWLNDEPKRFEIIIQWEES